MRRDSKAFRERFLRWKAGEAVYDAGKPIEHYANGTERGIPVYAPNAKYSLSANSYTLPEVVITGKDRSKSIFRKAYDAVKDADIAFLENPSVMTAAGHTASILGMHAPTEEERRLSDNLASIGFAGTLGLFGPTILPLAGRGLITTGDAVASTAAGQTLTNTLLGIKNAVNATKWWPYANLAITSGFAAHGADKIRRGDIHNVEDAVWTGLEVLPVISEVVGKGINTVRRFPDLQNKLKRYLFPKNHDAALYNYLPLGYTHSTLAQIDIAKEKVLAALRDHPALISAPVKRRPTTGLNFIDETLPVSVNIGGKQISGQTLEKILNPGGLIDIMYGQVPRKSADLFTLRIPDIPPLSVPRVLRETHSVNIPNFRFPVSNTEEFNRQLREYMLELQRQSGAPVVGSTRMISGGYYGGVPGDTEIIVPESKYEDVARTLGFKFSRNTKSGTGVTGKSDVAMSSNESENLDINILKDNGVIIHQMESTRNPNNMPSLYSRNARQMANTSVNAYPSKPFKTSSSLKIPKTEGGTYTADEYFDIIKDNESLLDQSVIDNTFKSNNTKHVLRAYVMMNDSDPNVVKRVSTAIDHMIAQIPHMRRFSDIYKSQVFDDITQNKKILEKIKFLPFDVDKFASNPEQMKNIVDYWYMRNTVGSRSVNFKYGGPAQYEDVMSAVRQYDNGSSAGGGGNTVLGGKFGGFTRDHTSYTSYSPVVDKNTAKFDDVFEAFEREKNIWRDEKSVKNAIENAIENFSNIKISDFSNFNSWFTDDFTRLVLSGKLTNEEADYLITQIAKNLKVSGVRGNLYSDLGTYFGGMQKPNYEFTREREPNWVAYRNIDTDLHNYPELPAEWGSDYMFLRRGDNNPKDDKINMYGVWPVWNSATDMKFEDAIKKYPENVFDLRGLREKALETINNDPRVKYPFSTVSDLQSQAIFNNEYVQVLKDAELVLKKEVGLDELEDAKMIRDALEKKRNSQRNDLILKYRLGKRKRQELKRLIIPIASSGAAIYGFGHILLSALDSKRMNRFYLDNLLSLDSLIESKIGKEPLSANYGSEKEFLKAFQEYYDLWNDILSSQYQEYKNTLRARRKRNK